MPWKWFASSVSLGNMFNVVRCVHMEKRTCDAKLLHMNGNVVMNAKLLHMNGKW